MIKRKQEERLTVLLEEVGVVVAVIVIVAIEEEEWLMNKRVNQDCIAEDGMLTFSKSVLINNSFHILSVQRALAGISST